ncbi:MAG: HD domain-containing protein [Lachnospiraceae bacterium]|nr:HD domain-containing protein [Lachnospiraceae bacterium]
MIYSDLTRKAINLMYEKHKDQKDKSGLPYVFHPWHVAESMEDEITACVALLHDVVEDTDTSPEELMKLGFPEEVCKAVELLTHDKNTDYEEYIVKISADPVARKVKLSDLRHNSDLTRLPAPDAKALARAEKYKRCIAFLEGETDSLS